MQNEEHQSLKHDFIFGGGPTNSYYFANGVGITYEIMFKSSGYLFPEYPEFNKDVCEFIIRIQENILTINPPSDSLLPKIDLEFEDKEVPVYTSLTLQAKHPLLQHIIVAYQRLILWADSNDK